ncbi:unnamed protein product [Acanthoscelides obtectus]|uniref:Uncharacterized protein n=1 Tax=Acanthoscelides obtectus TaxID=200917 RepID=A0A9P0PI87_ACAOB|nr:unnamed protein product [Acanthoscelides obtectus]CAK1675372.1 hypothetical protein AOBTE_LOCUS30174 [Acanthoscelides obtectus]
MILTISLYENIAIQRNRFPFFW